MKTICIMCPMGCPLDINEVNGEVIVQGNTCKRGADYGKQEYTLPKRVVTTLIRAGKGVQPVKTDGLVPKDKIFDILSQIESIRLPEPLPMHSVVVANIADTGVDVVVTGEPVSSRN